MKLQRLTIHNIASIENAVIDFDAQPLSESEVFLICGKTGAGKSTILDAICLALYATTPRLENTNMQGESVDADKEVKIDDPRQLMRRNTGEAFVELTFTGRNGIHYEAKWSVARARNKIQGNLQNKKWQLRNLDRGYLLTKDREIADEITAAIGLEFSQFCRTTMLAQGEFTKFLNSKDKEKAEILEKITGVDIYSKIGKKVFEITSGKQQEWEEAARLVAGIKVMCDEEIAENLAKIKAAEEEQAKLRREKEMAEKKLKWIEEDAIMTQKVKEATERYNEIAAQTQDEKFITNERLTKQWNETIDARGWLRNLTSAIRTKDLQNRILAESELKYQELKGGEAWLKADADKTEERLRMLDTEIESQKGKANIYDNVQAIVGLLRIIESGEKKIEMENMALTKAEKKLDTELTQIKKHTIDAFEKAKRALETQEAKQKSIEQKLADCKLPELRKEKETLQGTVTATDTALNKLEMLKDEHDRRRKKNEEIEEQEHSIVLLNNEIAALLPLIHDAQVKTDTCRLVLEKQRESVEKWAKAIRARLYSGDTCPVCLQKVGNCIPHEDEIDRLYSAAEQSWKEADQILNELKDKEKNLVADLRSQTVALNKAKSEIANDCRLKECEDTAKTACMKCGLKTMDETTQDVIVRLHDQAADALNNLNRRIKIAEDIENSVRESRKETELLREALESARKEMDEVEHKFNECKSEIDTSKKLIQSKKEEICDAHEKVNAFLGDSRWETDWNADINAFIGELTAETRLHNELKKSHQFIEQQLREKKMLISNVAQSMQAIQNLSPDWEIFAVTSKEITNLTDKVNELRTAIHAAIHQRTFAEKAASEAQSHLNSYLTAHAGISMAQLSALDVHAASDIAAIISNLSAIRQKMATCKTILDQNVKLQAEHSETKPEFEEDDTAISIKTRMEEIDREYNALGEKKGEINMLLKQDEENKKTQASLLADAAVKKDVYQRWSGINQMIGDATGSKFRKIAQSYVLTNLVRSANSYMRNLTDRYTLKVEPGTFVIMLEDAYQGYVSRAASTISGGEGFLVSLALALALSDIGNSLSVDTLFIDEGFGTLSGEPLQKAIDTLRNLHHKSARNVGIISHVEELRERIPVQIQVLQDGHNSSSQVRIVP